MCGVIVVDAGRSRCTNLGRDAYIMIIAWISSWVFEVLSIPNSNLFTHRLLFFSREATSETYGPRVSFSYYLPLRPTFSLHFFSDLLNQKYKNTLLQFILIYFIWCLIYQSTTNLSQVRLPILRRRTRNGLTTPFTRRVVRICYQCVVAVYIVLLGPPTGLITFVSYLREIPTAAVLHYPFLFGEIPT